MQAFVAYVITANKNLRRFFSVITARITDDSNKRLSFDALDLAEKLQWLVRSIMNRKAWSKVDDIELSVFTEETGDDDARVFKVTLLSSVWPLWFDLKVAAFFRVKQTPKNET